MSDSAPVSALARLCRVALGIAVVGALVAALFALASSRIHEWGTLPNERSLVLPGDELYTNPLVRWNHAITVDAPPAEVWPWIAQMGDARGGFYSFTFIENLVVGAMGGDNVVYRNADRIIPELQNPAPGDSLVTGQIAIREARPGEYLLGQSQDPEVMNWVWSWSIQPIDNGERTRLHVRFAITIAGPPNPVAGFFMDVGGFVMERRML